MKKIILLVSFFLGVQHTFAQTVFLSKGKIEFEKKTNVWIDLTGSFADDLKKTIPEYFYFSCRYNGGKNKSV